MGKKKVESRSKLEFIPFICGVYNLVFFILWYTSLLMNKYGIFGFKYYGAMCGIYGLSLPIGLISGIVAVLTGIRKRKVIISLIINGAFVLLYLFAVIIYAVKYS